VKSQYNRKEEKAKTNREEDSKQKRAEKT